MLTKQVLLVSLGAIVAVAVMGCAPTIVSTDAGVYQSRKLYAVSSKDIDAVYNATLQAMEKLELQVTDKAKDVFAAKVTANSADGKVIIVRIKPEGDKTAYSIQAGTFGDEARSRRIFDEIGKGLGMK